MTDRATLHCVLDGGKICIEKKVKEQRAAGAAEKAKGPAAPPAPRFFTPDGSVPNGGVPPGRLLMHVARPKGKPAGWDQNDALPSAHDLTFYRPHVSQDGNTNSAPARAPVGDRSEIAPLEWPHTQININIHGTGQEGAKRAARADSDSYTVISFILDGVRPCAPNPRPFSGTIRKSTERWAKARPLISFLRAVGVPQQPGYGVQQVFPLDQGVWGAGQIFEWGVGEAYSPIGQTTLSTGTDERKVYICSWRRAEG